MIALSLIGEYVSRSHWSCSFSVKQFAWPLDDHLRARRGEFLPRAVSPQDAHCGNSVFGCCANVIGAVADHARLVRFEFLHRDEVFDQFSLVIKSAIALGTIDAGEKRAEAEMIGNTN